MLELTQQNVKEILTGVDAVRLTDDLPTGQNRSIMAVCSTGLNQVPCERLVGIHGFSSIAIKQQQVINFYHIQCKITLAV